MFKLLTRFRTPTLSNTGSTARDHLASERTFLAWLRTGLGFIALGIGVERFSKLEAPAPAPHLLPDRSSDATNADEDEDDAKAHALKRQHQRQLEQQQEQQIVAVLLGTGTASIVYGATRYFTNLGLMTQGLFKPAYHGAAMLSVAVAGLAGGAWVGFASDEARERHGKVVKPKKRQKAVWEDEDDEKQEEGSGKKGSGGRR